MELEYFGGNCLKISTKKAILVVDDNLEKLGLKSITKEGLTILYTAEHEPPKTNPKLIIDIPGEYEISNVSIQGIATRSYTDESKQKSAVIFKITAEDIRLLITGHIYPELTDEQVEAIGPVDVMVVPVGDMDFTLSGQEALKIVKKIEPKIIIPTYYADKQLKYPSSIQTLDEALKDLAMEVRETLPKLKIKPTDLTDTAQLIVLERQ